MKARIIRTVGFVVVLVACIACDSEVGTEIIPSGQAGIAPPLSLQDGGPTEDEMDSLVDAESVSTEDGEVEEGPTCDIDFLETEEIVASCAYVNPFDQANECRNYYGDWTVDEVAGECDGVFAGVAGAVYEGPCNTTNLLGTCGADIAEGKYLSVLFYDGDPEQLSSVCSQFLDGKFCVEDGGGEVAVAADPLEEAFASLASDEFVSVVPECLDDACLGNLLASRQGIVFTPLQEEVAAGFVIYPGAQVDPRAYAPVAYGMAKMGIKVVIVPMPGNLAIAGMDRAKDVITGDVDVWFLGGHSMGGAMAASYVNLFQGEPEIAGLVLWASYADAASDLSANSIPVLSISGGLDGVTTPEEVDAGKVFLPSQSEYVVLEGANHAQFGAYGAQEGDLVPELLGKEQLQMVAGLTTHFIKRVTWGLPSPHAGFLKDSNPSGLCAEGQAMIVADASGFQFPEIVVEAVEGLEAFGDSKPSLDTTTGATVIAVKAMLRSFANGMLPEYNEIVDGEVWCKLKTQVSFDAGVGSSTGPDAFTCADLNQRSFELAAKGLGSEAAFAVSMGADLTYETGLDWLKMSHVVHEDGLLHSASLEVGNDLSLPEPFRNVIYCKVWSPARALYFLMTGQ